MKRFNINVQWCVKSISFYNLSNLHISSCHVNTLNFFWGKQEGKRFIFRPRANTLFSRFVNDMNISWNHSSNELSLGISSHVTPWGHTWTGGGMTLKTHVPHSPWNTAGRAHIVHWKDFTIKTGRGGILTSLIVWQTRIWRNTGSRFQVQIRTLWTHGIRQTKMKYDMKTWWIFCLQTDRKQNFIPWALTWVWKNPATSSVHQTVCCILLFFSQNKHYAAALKVQEDILGQRAKVWRLQRKSNLWALSLLTH